MAITVFSVATIVLSLSADTASGLPELETLEGDFEHELQDLLEGIKLPFEPSAVPPSCHADVERLCVHSTNPLHQLMWLNCLHDRKADMSGACLEDYVRTLPFVCKTDEARFCEAQEQKRLQCLFGVVKDVSGRCRLSVEIASIVLRQRRAKEAAAALAKTPWHDAAETAIEAKHKKENLRSPASAATTTAAATVAPGATTPGVVAAEPSAVAAFAPAAALRASGIIVTDPLQAAKPSIPTVAQSASTDPSIAETQKGAKSSLLDWLTKARWIFAVAFLMYMLGFMPKLEKSWLARKRERTHECSSLMNVNGNSYGAGTQFPL